MYSNPNDYKEMVELHNSYGYQYGRSLWALQQVAYNEADEACKRRVGKPPLEHKASDEAVIVSASDKIHNLLSILTDHTTHGDDLWEHFTAKSSADQLWWYESILRSHNKTRCTSRIKRSARKACKYT